MVDSPLSPIPGDGSGLPGPAHRKWAILWWSLALVCVLVSFGCLLYALSSPSAAEAKVGLGKHVSAIVWQVGQMAAIVCFGLGMWQSKKHRHWQREQQRLRGEVQDPWD
ncbi:hypothetical protein EBQ26_09095 [Allofranklinella schreckenbergeri]|uniref:Uncharacterized protein n=1 Tax=Allofranklinella schreckenbergeri TaxID=1076744 RepID=A0A3M6Q3F6_9BURK|nr:hypothetical protein [Allofranklinella schreckenbergeri]RMW96961.1 hypothetical protein EBQ26_09095 [Allofranklinella schreckenbergeri]RRD39976.1 hypothetical protein EII18_11840 [Comamonadaceae bacterium OH3737_COT-264]